MRCLWVRRKERERERRRGEGEKRKEGEGREAGLDLFINKAVE